MVFKVVVIEEEDDTKQLRSFSHISNVCSEDSLRLVFYLTVWVSSFYSNKSPLLAHSIIFRPHLSSATLRPVPNTPLFSTSCSAYLTVENVVCFMIRAFCGPQDSYFFSFTVFATCTLQSYLTVIDLSNSSPGGPKLKPRSPAHCLPGIPKTVHCTSDQINYVHSVLDWFICQV